MLQTFLAVAFAIVSFSVSAERAAAADVCPDFIKRECLERIRWLIDRMDYSKARDEADLQCHGEPPANQSGIVTAASLLTVVSGCHYLYLVERVLGNGAQAVEAREQARRIALFGCNSGHADICEANAALLAESLTDLLPEIEADLKLQPPNLGLRKVEASRALGKSFVARAEASLKQAVPPPLKPGTPPAHWLDVRLDIESGGLIARVATYAPRSTVPTWSKSYASSDIAARQKFFGFGVNVPDGALRSRIVRDYKPDLKIVAAMGLGKMKNLAGTKMDDQRVVMHIRSAERLSGGRNEVGLMLSIHATLRKVFGKTKQASSDTPSDDTASSETGEGPPAVQTAYPVAVASYFQFNHVFFGALEPQAGVRPALNLGIGAFLTNQSIAPAARAGFDVFFGRHLYIGGGALYNAKANALLDFDDERDIPPASGGDLVFGWSF